LPVHGLPRWPGHHQGDRRRRQGTDAVCEVHRALSKFDSVTAKACFRRCSMIYLDNAATSYPKPETVYQALDRFARQSLANPGRAGHKMAVASERTLDDTRHLFNQFFHGEGPERFIFTLNCTDGLNMAFKGVLVDGDHVVTTDLEHNSVSRPL